MHQRARECAKHDPPLPAQTVGLRCFLDLAGGRAWPLAFLPSLPVASWISRFWRKLRFLGRMLSLENMSRDKRMLEGLPRWIRGSKMASPVSCVGFSMLTDLGLVLFSTGRNKRSQGTCSALGFCCASEEVKKMFPSRCLPYLCVQMLGSR